MGKKINRETDNGNTTNPRRPLRPGTIIGYGIVAFGILSIIDAFSPIPIPTVGMSAIVTGLISIAIGSIVLIPDKSSVLVRLKKLVAKPAHPRVPIDPLLPVRILKLAEKRHGILTLSIVAVELEVPLPEAEAGLDECVRFGHAAADFDMGRQTTYYRFHEHLPPTSDD